MDGIKIKRILSRLLTLSLAAGMLVGIGGCGKKTASPLDPKNPVVLTVWHYYNGSQMSAFDALVEEFNNSVGQEKGIHVVGYSKSSVSDLESAILDSLNEKVGAEPLPDIFSSYADTAYTIEKTGKLANLSDYFTPEELEAYIPAYVDEGRIAADGSLRIFPVAKSTEVMILNKTDWDAFASATGVTLEQLETIEGVVEVARTYYQWTDSLTPDIPDDGKAFYGRDAVANYFFTGARQMGQELLEIRDDRASVHADKQVFRRLWENYYVPMVSGWFGAYGKFRSDDVKTGNLIAYTGSTASAGYFPTQVETGADAYPIDFQVLPAPIFAGGEKIVVQQGAGMVVTKSDVRRETAAAAFLRWFTRPENNVIFGAGSGYLPVTEQSHRIETFRKIVSDRNMTMNPITDTCIHFVVEEMDDYTYYSPKTFTNGSAVRKVLEYGLSDKAAADLQAIQAAVDAGRSRTEVLEDYVNEKAFDAWYEAFLQSLNQAAAK